MSVAVAATIALGATGCEFISPAQTKEIKQITDGVNVSTGTLDVRNALLISDDGDGARFVGTLVNTDEQDDITVSIEVGGDTQTVEVGANTHVDLAASSASSDSSSVQEGDTTQGTAAGEPQDVVFSDAEATPGSLVKVYFSYSGAEGVSANVPVLTSAQEEYATLAPTPTPTSTSTAPSESGTQPTGDATAPGTQSGDSQTDSSEGDNGTE
uniref:DNA modification methylase n=1 Tax=Neobacillus citreus TaxID=2833578 RepID=A0A942SWF9_9BACI